MHLWSTLSGANTDVSYDSFQLSNNTYDPQYSSSVTGTSCIPAITPLTQCSPPLIFKPYTDRVVPVYDLWSGYVVTTLRGAHFGKVQCCALRTSYNGIPQLYTGATDSNIIMWKSQVGEARPWASALGANERDHVKKRLA